MDYDKDFVSWKEFFSHSQLGSLALVCLAVWLHGTDGLVMATMIPQIVDDVGGSGLVGWSISLYEMGSIVAGSAGALLTMRYGLRRPMSWAAFVFGLGCLWSSFAHTMPHILFGRILQGLGGGGLVAMVFIAVNALFSRRYVARALATVSMLWGTAAFVGPLLGGAFVTYATWRIGFVVFALQAFALSLWIALRQGHEELPSIPVASGFPWGRLLLLCLAVLLVSFGSVEDGLWPTIALIGTGLLCLAAYFILDASASEGRLLPRHAMDPRRPEGAILPMVLLIANATIGLMAFGPLMMTHIHGLTALEAGYVVACTSIGWTLASVLVSGAAERSDRYLVACGISLAVVAVIGFAYAVPHGPIWLIALFSGIQGGGLGLAWTFLFRLATGLVAKEEIPRISGAIAPIQRLGYALGAAYLGTAGNALGLKTLATHAEVLRVAYGIYLGAIPFALLAWVLMMVFVTRAPLRERST